MAQPREGAGGHEGLAPSLGARGARTWTEEQRVGERLRTEGKEAAQGAVAAGAGAAPVCYLTQTLSHVLGAQPLAQRVGCTRLCSVHAAVPPSGACRPWWRWGQASVL